MRAGHLLWVGLQAPFGRPAPNTGTPTCKACPPHLA
nr:MAG TPA_asm: Man1-Src1p-C-terminal domain [Caudoviricetes sp.]